MDRVVGIDLGTTNSLVAILEDGGPRVLLDPDTGAHLLPSAVSFLPDGEVVVGERARQLAAQHPFDTILSVKASGLGPEHVTDGISTASPGGHAGTGALPRGGRGRCSRVWATCSASSVAGRTGWEPVAGGRTVPAYFNDGQRQATKDSRPRRRRDPRR
jgi:molecular chaperone HscA